MIISFSLRVTINATLKGNLLSAVIHLSALVKPFRTLTLPQLHWKHTKTVKLLAPWVRVPVPTDIVAYSFSLLYPLQLFRFSLDAPLELVLFALEILDVLAKFADFFNQRLLFVFLLGALPKETRLNYWLLHFQAQDLIQSAHFQFFSKLHPRLEVRFP